MSSNAPSAPPRDPLPAGSRCGVHPVRRAVDRCPVCARPRCAADAAAAPGGGCEGCGAGRPAGEPGPRPASSLERAVRAALAAVATALLGGVVAAQYVDAELFAYLTPFVVGVLTAAAAQAASGGSRRGPEAQRLRGIAGAYAVLGVAFGFALEGSTEPRDPAALVPYVAAVVGVLLWTVPPKQTGTAGQPGADR